jgi:hypothetical protein
MITPQALVRNKKCTPVETQKLYPARPGTNILVVVRKHAAHAVICAFNFF